MQVFLFYIYRMKRFILKSLKITGAIILTLLLLLFLIPILFPGTVVEKTKAWANKNINGELNFSGVRLSFFNHFPSLTVSLHDVVLKGSAPFAKDTLVSAGEIALGVNLKSLLFNKHLDFNKIFVSSAFMNVKINEKGEANYNVYIAEKKQPDKKDSSSTSLRLQKITIGDTHLIYDDKSTGMHIDAKGFSYSGNGDLSEEIFDLYSHVSVDSLDFYYGGEPYLIHKRLNADLITQINTHSLAFIFQKNRLRLNRLPVEFSGRLNFLENGYDIDLNLTSSGSKLRHLITAFPPQYISWLEKTKVKGEADIRLSLKGKYIASQQKSPDLAFGLRVRDGYIKYEDAPAAASNLFLDLETSMPSLDPDSLHIKMDSIFFNVDKDYLSGIIDIRGMNKPWIDAKVRADMDLTRATKAFGLQTVKLSGLLKMNMVSKGRYDPAGKAFPVTRADIAWQNGAIQTSYYPHPINTIHLIARINNGEGTLKDLHVSVKPFSFSFEGRPFQLQAALDNFDNIRYAIGAKGEIDVAKIYKVFSRKGLELNGYIKANVDLAGNQQDAMNGQYDKLHNSGTLELRDIKTTSEYFPYPFIIKQGLFTFDQDKISFDNFRGAYAHSDFNMNGYLQNVIEYMLSTTGVLGGNFSLSSDYINADEFATPAGTTMKKDTAGGMEGIIIIPPNYNLGFTANAKKMVFNGMNIDSIHARLAIDTGVLTLSQAGFNLIGCNVKMNAIYGNSSPRKAFFDYGITAKDFDIARAYKEVPIFHDLASSAANCEGIVSIDYKLKGALDGNMHPVYPSLEGGGTISVKDVKVKGLKLFAAISKAAAKDSINDPHLKTTDIKTTIKNNIINIEKFKFKVYGFRPRIEGQTSFDGALNLKIRLGLPPLGIIGIPLNVTGTQDDPKVRLGKGKNNEIQETEYQQ